MRNLLLRISFLLAVAASTAFAQNSDLGLMLGASIPVSSTVGPAFINESVGVSGAIEYAFQLRDTRAGKLYLEFPLILSATATETVSAGLDRSAVYTNVFFTPGPRWQFTPASRVSFYASAGGGLAGFGRTLATSAANLSQSDIHGTITLGLGLGVGMDLRLTRLVSLRAEGRDMITRSRFDGSVNHTFFLVGVGLHF